MNFGRMLHWEKLYPRIEGNLDLPEGERFSLLVAVGLTKLDLRAVQQAALTLESIEVEEPKEGTAPEEIFELASAKVAERLAEAWGPFLKVGPGTHSINGVPIDSIVPFLKMCSQEKGLFHLREIFRALIRLNSIEGTAALFSDAPSGGPSSTGGTPGQTGAR